MRTVTPCFSTVMATATMDESCDENVKETPIEEKTKKPTEAGVIYLSTIPQFMSVKKIREIFSEYGDVDRVFLQPQERKTKKKNTRFTEGWIEFKNKKIAKRVATHLNNTQICGKRRSKYFDCIWTMKYLHRFRWTHLSERLSYEKAVHDQRMRTEISQAKRETEHYIRAVASKKHQNRRGTKAPTTERKFEIRQIPTENEIKQRLGKVTMSTENAPTFDKTLLAAVFGGKD